MLAEFASCKAVEQKSLVQVPLSLTVHFTRSGRVAAATLPKLLDLFDIASKTVVNTKRHEQNAFNSIVSSL